MPQITFFTTAKPFKGNFDLIQRNALRSWQRLTPSPQILILGDEFGTDEIAKEIGATHIPLVERNEFGTPLLSSLFELGQSHAVNDLVCYSNSDLIFTDDFTFAVESVFSQLPNTLFFSQRYDISLEHPINFEDPLWQQKIRTEAINNNHPEKLQGLSDYFVFAKGALKNLPHMAIGRTAFDNWIFYQARRQKMNVVNATESVLVIHSRHDYSHHPSGWEGVWRGKEARENKTLSKGTLELDFGLKDVTHRLTPLGLIATPKLKYLLRQLQLAPWLYQILAPLKSFYLFLRKISNTIKKIQTGFATRILAGKIKGD